MSSGLMFCDFAFSWCDRDKSGCVRNEPSLTSLRCYSSPIVGSCSPRGWAMRCHCRVSLKLSNYTIVNPIKTFFNSLYALPTFE